MLCSNLETSARDQSNLMNASHLLELMNRSPFEPLEIHLDNGTTIEVTEPYQIATAPHAAAFIVYSMHEDVARHVAYRNVAEIVTKTASAN